MTTASDRCLSKRITREKTRSADQSADRGARANHGTSRSLLALRSPGLSAGNDLAKPCGLNQRIATLGERYAVWGRGSALSETPMRLASSSWLTSGGVHRCHRIARSTGAAAFVCRRPVNQRMHRTVSMAMPLLILRPPITIGSPGSISLAPDVRCAARPAQLHLFQRGPGRYRLAVLSLDLATAVYSDHLWIWTCEASSPS